MHFKMFRICIIKQSDNGFSKNDTLEGNCEYFPIDEDSHLFEHITQGTYFLKKKEMSFLNPEPVLFTDGLG